MEGSNLNLSALKDKIFDKLSATASKSSKTNDAGKSQKESKSKSSKSAKKAKGENIKSTNQAKPPAKNNVNGKSKADKKPKAKSEAPVKKADSDSEPADEEDVLRREALSFGATEEDLKLLEGIEGTDEEKFGKSKSDKNLASDVSKFIQSLGISGELDVVDDDEEDGEDGEDFPPKNAESSKIHEDKDTKKEEARNARQLEKEAKREAKRQEKVAKKEEKRIAREQKEAEEAKKAALDEAKEEDKPQTAFAERRKNPYKVDNVQSVISDKLKIETRVDWYNCEVPKVEEPEKCDRFAVERLMEKAKALIDSENRLYLEEFKADNSQKKFLSQILSGGTLADKISALTLLVQEAPLHNIKAFDSLMSYCEKKSRSAALQAINSMKDLLLNGLLPDRKLLAFNKQDLSKDATPERLALYYFEDHLKKSYFKFIQVLEHLSHDPISHVKMNVVTHIFDLLKGKPEQEANLLRLGVNKLGDSDNQVASKTSYQLLQLQEAHPAMKKVITDSISDLIFQKQNDYHAQYYTILTLNQTVFRIKDVELANSLVKTYFSLFEKILVDSDRTTGEVDKLGGDKTLGKFENGRNNNRKSFKKGKKGGKSVKVEEKTESEVLEEKNSKMFSAVLTGLNRAFPYAKLSAETYMAHLDTLYKITHSTNFNTSVQALILVQQIVTSQNLDSDRYYRTLYESLMDPRLVTSSKQGLYLNLLYKSLKNDVKNVPRILAFVKRILQICSHWVNIGSITGMFFLLMELSKAHPQILELMEAVEARPEEDDSVESANTEYDPKKRDPKFAHADKSCFWEMVQFTNHYHPTVAIYASSFVDGTPQPKPDLGLYTLAHFLDKFVYRNAKQKAVTRGTSIMQPLGGAHLNSLLVRSTNTLNDEGPANTVDWLSRRAETIRPDEKFFYDYFMHNRSKIRTKKPKEESDDDDENDDEDENAVWGALVQSNPQLEGSEDEADFSDFEDADFDDISDGEVPLDAKALAELEGNLEDFDSGEEADGLVDGAQLEGSDEEMFKFSGNDEISSEDETEIAGGKRQRGNEQESGKKKKKKLSSLPTFASTEDYAQYLQSDDDDM